MDTIIHALLWILPAYFANGAPVLAVYLLRRTGRRLHPVDRGAFFIDGKRLLGDNKTIEGFIGGIIAGAACGALLQMFGLHDIFSALLLSVGALLGDILGAFIKRRLGLKPGDPAPLLDQLDFVVGATLAYYLYRPVPIEYVAVVLAITPFVHFATNIVAYALKLKGKPW